MQWAGALPQRAKTALNEPRVPLAKMERTRLLNTG